MAVSNTTKDSHAGGPIAAGHWWYRGRRAAVVALARRTGVTPGGRVLDYGNIRVTCVDVPRSGEAVPGRSALRIELTRLLHFLTPATPGWPG